MGGVHAGTKRLQLKSVLERYGEIDICHKAGFPKAPSSSIVSTWAFKGLLLYPNFGVAATVWDACESIHKRE